MPVGGSARKSSPKEKPVGSPSKASASRQSAAQIVATPRVTASEPARTKTGGIVFKVSPPNNGLPAKTPRLFVQQPMPRQSTSQHLI
jgi:hypothetical protein